MTVYEKCVFVLVYCLSGILDILLLQIQSLFYQVLWQNLQYNKNNTDINFNFLQCTVIEIKTLVLNHCS